MPRVSIIIPTFRHRDYILESLASVFAQSFEDYEVIVVNDGSPDDTEALLRPLAESGRIRYVKTSNSGQAAARNRGIALAGGEYIALLDDDDLWPGDKLGWQVEVLGANPEAVLVYGYSRAFGGKSYRSPEGIGPSGDVGDQLFKLNWITSPGMTLIRTAAIRKVGGFDTSIWGADDWDLYLRLSQTGSFIYQDRLALKYRCHPDNASRNYLRMYRNCRLVQRKHAKAMKRAVQLNSFIRDVYFWECVADAERRSISGQWHEAARMVIDGLRMWPGALRRPRVLSKLAGIFFPDRKSPVTI